MTEIAVMCRICEGIFTDDFGDLDIDLIESLHLDMCEECEIKLDDEIEENSYLED